MQLEAHQDYKEILPVIFIGILGFKLFPWNHSPSHLFIMDEKTKEKAFDMFEWHLVELPKFRKTEDEVKTDEERWIYLFKNAAKLGYVPPCLEQLKATEKAMEVLDRHMWSKEELEAFERMLHSERVQRSVMETARAEGEAKRNKEIAKQMLSKGLDICLIKDVTGLSDAEIEEIK